MRVKRKNSVIIKQIFSTSSVRKCMESDTRICMWILRHTLISRLQLRSATQQLSRDVCHGGQSCVCSQCSIADHAQKLKHSHVMWLETTVRNRYIGQSYWDTHYSAKSCNGAEKYSTLVWKRENKNNPLNTLVKEIFLYILSYMRNFRPSLRVELFM